MSPSDLLSLPPELQAAILSHLHAYEDLENTSLVCRQLWAVSVKLLYRDVALDVAKWQAGLGFYEVGHRGHPYVRTMDFYIHDWHIELEQPVNTVACQGIRLALELLPDHSLTGITTPVSLMLDMETALALVLRQRKLKRLLIQGALFESMSMLLPSLGSSLPELECVAIPQVFGTASDLTFYGTIIKACPNIKAIRLTDSCEDYFDVLEDDLKDNIQRDGLVSTACFGHLQPYHSHSQPPLVLEQLQLDFYDLTYCNRNIGKVVKFEELTHLTVNVCDGEDSLFHAIATRFQSYGAALKALRYHASDFGVRGPNSLYRLLRSFGGLQFLVVSIAHPEIGASKMDLSCLANHIQSLKQLYLAEEIWDEGYEEIGSYSSPLDIAALLGKATSLRQAALAFPDITVGGIDGPIGIDYKRVFKLAVLNTKIQFLRILSWPWIPDCELEKHTDTADDLHLTYFGMLDIFVRQLIDELRGGEDSTGLKVIFFGGMESLDGCCAAPWGRERRLRLKTRAYAVTRNVEVGFIAVPIERDCVGNILTDGAPRVDQWYGCDSGLGFETIGTYF